jgi:predicted RNA binding protein YcfA (HicA-like mRNA interferase family)
MPKLPSLTGKQLIRALNSLGFQVVRTRGSHHFLAHADGRATVVPLHAGETLGPGLIAKILRDCEIDRDDLARVL